MGVENIIVPKPWEETMPEAVRTELVNRRYLAAAICMCSTQDMDANFLQAEQLILQSVEQGARMVGLPENFSYIGEEKKELALAESIASRSQAFLLEQAKAHNIILLGGGFAVPSGEEGKCFNRAQLVGPSGVLAEYNKIHLFDVDLPDRTFRESDGTTPGTETVVWDCELLGKPGLSVCYDLRFPELYRELAAAGSQVIFVPAAFTAYTGASHWELLLRARAVENTCYLIAPAQGGQHFDGRHSYGHAMIVDPWGDILAETSDERGVAIAEIDLQRVDQVRAQIPSLKHRKL